VVDYRALRYGVARTWLTVWASLVALSGCSQAITRFEPPITNALAERPMRRLETEDMLIYYPVDAKDEVLRLAPRFQYCMSQLRTFVPLTEKLRIVMPAVAYNNAYVTSALLPHTVVPTFNTSEIFGIMGLPPDPGAIACHELVHYMQRLQVHGVPEFLTELFGYYYTSQIGLDSWFWEGLAVYYETKLQRGIGRLASEYIHGLFTAAVANHDINGGDMSPFMRGMPTGGNYLIGARFVDYLARTYGEEKLWKIVWNQSDETLPILGVNVRFSHVYGKSLSALIDEFSAHMRTHLPAATKPAAQHTVRALEQQARYARARTGHEAFVTYSVDSPVELTIVDPHGRVIMHRNLTDTLPPRTLVAPWIGGISGLSWTADGRHLYFVAVDQGVNVPQSRLVHVDVPRGEIADVMSDLHGAGGSISPDGRTYYYARTNNDRFDLAAYDLRTRATRVLAAMPPQTYVQSPRVSPDGRKLAVTLAEPSGFHLVVMDAHTGARLQRVPGPEGNQVFPSWVDDHTLLYSGRAAGTFQVFVADVVEQTYRQVTSAPHMAFEPFGDATRVRFLDRYHWSWTLDEVPMPPASSTAPSPNISSSPSTQSTTQSTESTPSTNPDQAKPDAIGAVPAASPDPIPSHAAEFARDPKDQPAPVVADTPYSHFDRLFIPELRGFSLAFGPNSIPIGLGATGGDMLSFHRWSIAGAYDLQTERLSGSFQYINRAFAPWEADLVAGHFVVPSDVLLADAEDPVTSLKANNEVAATLRRTLWGTVTPYAGFHFTDYTRTYEGDDLEPRRALGGFRLGANYVGVESVPYVGVRRGVQLGVHGAYYPDPMTTLVESLTDVGAAIALTTPLPLWRRHTLTAFASGRTLFGSPEAQTLLQVGGVPLGLPLVGETSGLRSQGALPVGVSFTELVRGYEDLALFGQSYVGGELRYRAPFIFDVGNASSLGVLPSTFLRQMNWELFATGGVLWSGTHEYLAALGSSLSIDVVFWTVPIRLTGQLAKRLQQDRGVNALLLLGLGL
jgi:hypothetical protein